MRGGTDDRVAGQRPGLGVSESAGEFINEARAATDLMVVQELITRLCQVPGVRAAALTVAALPDDDPFADLRTAAPPDAKAELVRIIGPDEWRLALRVTFTDPGTYVRLSPAVDEIAKSADRVLRRPCTRLARVPGALPTQTHAELCGNAPAVIVLVDPASGWIPVSDAFDALFGRQPGTGLTDGLLALVHPMDRAAVIGTFLEVCAGRPVPDPMDLRLRGADGQWLILEVVTRGFLADNGAVRVAYYGVDVTRDRAARRLAQSEHTRLVQLVATLPDGIIIVEPDGRIGLANEVARRLLRLDRPDPAVPEDWDTYLETVRAALVEPQAATACLRELHTDTQAVTGVQVEFSDGRVLELDAVPLNQDGVADGTLLHLRDVTAKVATVRGLEHQSEDPGISSRVIAEASALNNEFVSMVVHELRGPLSSVVAFSCLLEDPGTGRLSADQRGHLEVIDRNAHRLLRLIEDLLLLSRLEAHTLRLHHETVRLRDLLGAAVSEHEPAAGTVGIELRRDLGDGPDLSGDSARLYQVIGKILANALHFTPRGGQITVRSRYGRQRWTVEVADTGIGIPATDLPRLFSAFFRGSNVTSAMGCNTMPGAGLGLIVCRAVVELHGGAIQVASTQGIGTTVTLTLPVGPAAGTTSTNIGG